MSYIIKNEKIIAKTTLSYKSGTEVEFAYETCDEAIDANREKNLINPRGGKISNAKKWERKWGDSNQAHATEINPGEFLVD